MITCGLVFFLGGGTPANCCAICSTSVRFGGGSIHGRGISFFCMLQKCLPFTNPHPKKCHLKKQFWSRFPTFSGCQKLFFSKIQITIGYRVITPPNDILMSFKHLKKIYGILFQPFSSENKKNVFFSTFFFHLSPQVIIPCIRIG